MGTLCHHYKETGETAGCFPYPLTKRHVKILEVAERKVFMSGIDRERWWPSDQGKHEVTFAFSPFTYELREYRHDPKNADAWKKQFAAAEWVTGTIDWLAKRNGRWLVDDLKTGAWPVDPETSKQLRTYAIVVWLLDGRPEDWECDVSITSWPKYPLAGDATRAWHVLTAFDLREHLEDLKWALTHTDYVNPSRYDNSQDGKLPHCAGCECREPVPGISGWVTHFFYRTMPHCAQGMIKRVYG